MDKTIPLPEGVGLRLEDARTLLQSTHDSRVGLDDPLLMQVTLHNAFLADYQALLDRHHQALTALFSAKAAEYLAEARAAAEALTTECSSSSAAAITRIFAEHRRALGRLRTHLAVMTACIVVAALAVVTAAFFL